MKARQFGRRAFTLVEIMTVVGIVGILSAVAVPALVHIKHKSEDVLALNTLRQLYNAKEMFFSEDGAGASWVNVPKLVKAGYVSRSLEASTQQDIGSWDTSELPGYFLKPGAPIKITERFQSGGVTTFGREMSYPEEKK